MRAMIGALLALAAALNTGCDRAPTNPPSPNGDAGAAPPPEPSHWRMNDEGDAATSIDDDALIAELDAASFRARESAPEARELWLKSRLDEKDDWLIKWGAPLVEGEGGSPPDSGAEPARPPVEHVWVQPRRWSLFRIEGVLLSTPARDIGHRRGDLVAFPIEELSDWVFKMEGRMDGPRRGAFTVDVLESHFGRPLNATTESTRTQSGD